MTDKSHLYVAVRGREARDVCGRQHCARCGQAVGHRSSRRNDRDRGIPTRAAAAVGIEEMVVGSADLEREARRRGCRDSSRGVEAERATETLKRMGCARCAPSTMDNGGLSSAAATAVILNITFIP